MIRPWTEVEKELIEGLNSHKYIFLAYKQGSGKTHTTIKVTNDMYKYSAFIGDTHELNSELHLDYKLNNPYFIDMFGKSFDKISPELQKKMGYPACMCNYRYDPNYYLKKLKYLPYDWCSKPTGEERTKETLKNRCPHVFACKHKEMISTALNSLKNKEISTNITWLMVKAYLETDMIDAFLKVDKPVGILDENILGLCFEQVNLDVKSIRKFFKLADRIVKGNPILKEVWTPFKEILEKLDLYLTYRKDNDLEVKIEAITKKIKELLGSFEVEVIINWHQTFNSIILKNVKEIKGTYNIMDQLIKILQDYNKDIENFKQNVTMDKDAPVISLFISKVERIRSIVKKFHKLIFTDALLPTIITEMSEILQIGDDYKTFQNTSVDCVFREVNVLKLNKQRGKYTKNTLLNLEHTGFSEAFNKLINYSIDIIQFQAEQGRKIGLLGSMKIFQSKIFNTNIQKELKDVVEKYDVDISYDHYGNIKGKNCYSNVDWIIAFGGYNSPQRIRKILSIMLKIDMNKLEYLHGPAALEQLAHRGRTILRPGVVSIYFLTNDIKGVFKQEKEFYGIMEIENRDLLNQLTRHGGVTTNYVESYLGISNQSALYLLNKLFTEGLIKQRQLQTGGRGRRSWVWYI